MYRHVPIRSALPNLSAPKRVCKLLQNSSASLNRSAPVSILAPGTSYMNFTEPIHENIVQTQHVLVEITMAAMTTWFSADGLERTPFVWFSLSLELFNSLRPSDAYMPQ